MVCSELDDDMISDLMDQTGMKTFFAFGVAVTLFGAAAWVLLTFSYYKDLRERIRRREAGSREGVNGEEPLSPRSDEAYLMEMKSLRRRVSEVFRFSVMTVAITFVTFLLLALVIVVVLTVAGV